MIGHARQGDGEHISGLVAGQMAALECRVAEANAPGSLDGLMAYHVLDGTRIAFAWNVSPFGGAWLDSHADRLDEAPVLAALGFGLAHFSVTAGPTLVEGVCAGLRRLMQRDPFQGDRLSFLYDVRQVTGIRLAAAAANAQVPELSDWLRNILRDPRRQAAGRFDDLMACHTLAVIEGEPVHVTDATSMTSPAELAMVHWMISAGTARLADPNLTARDLERRVLAEAIRRDPRDLRIPVAALALRAAGQVLSASVDELVLGRSHVGQILRRFQPAMRRWRWDSDQLQNPVRWTIGSEREVQDILWIMLRSVFDDVVDEETLPKVGHSAYRADFGLPRLGVLIEAKFARKAEDFKNFEQELMVDSIGYLKETDRYKEIVVFIYDDSSSVEQHDLTYRTLMGVPGIVDVVIVSRPGVLSPSRPAPARRPRSRTAATR